jgi:5-methylcytosine-specific restriction endonuclease McrA
MGRLKTLPSRLGTLPPALASLPIDAVARDRQRADLFPWRAWYRTPRWRAIRIATFMRDGFTCQHCGRLEGNTSLLVANHKQPHRGDPVLFWDEGNIETACKPCHDGPIQAAENAAMHRRS